MHGEHIPFRVDEGIYSANAGCFLGPAARCLCCAGPQSRRGFVCQIWKRFQLVRFDFPQNRGASPGQLKAVAVELKQLKVSFNPFTSGI